MSRALELSSARLPGPPVIALITAGLMLLGVGLLSPASLFVVFTNGSIAAGIVLAGTGLGLGLVRALRLNDTEIRWQLLLAAGLGLGALSSLVLGLGLIGVLHRAAWIAVLVAGGIIGAWRVSHMRLRQQEPVRGPAGSGSWLCWYWLVVAAFGAVALVAASFPPGILWPAEGNGYDVLEYHLGAPREYYEAGRIIYLPHNIYSNLPFGVEMLYLLTMVLHADPIAAALTAQMLNVLLAGLAVAAIWLAGREHGRIAGLVAGLGAATCPFLAYLCGLAYVENGMVFWTALALAAVIRAGRSGAVANRWMLAAGLLCGLACGCKYSAVGMVFLPLVIATAWMGLRASPRRLAIPLLFGIGCALTFGPWLAKNAVFTGSPVFPLARGVFPERAGIWDDADAARWQEGHLPAPEDRPFWRRLSRLWYEVLGAGLSVGKVGSKSSPGPEVNSVLFGPVVGLGLVLGIGGAVMRRHLLGDGRHGASSGAEVLLPAPSPVACWLMLVVGIVCWLGWSHLVGRFAITLLPPAAVLLGTAWEILRMHRGRAFLGTLLSVLLGYHVYASMDPLLSGLTRFADAGVAGRTALIPRLVPHVARLNALAASGARVLMVGDARRYYLNPGIDCCVVFSRNPFAEAAAVELPADLLGWLRGHHYAYVYVDWLEMDRLRSTRYGFWPSVDVGLFQRLYTAGLRPIEQFSLDENHPPYATLYAVPPALQTTSAPTTSAPRAGA